MQYIEYVYYCDISDGDMFLENKFENKRGKTSTDCRAQLQTKCKFIIEA